MNIYNYNNHNELLITRSMDFDPKIKFERHQN